MGASKRGDVPTTVFANSNVFSYWKANHYWTGSKPIVAKDGGGGMIRIKHQSGWDGRIVFLTFAETTAGSSPSMKRRVTMTHEGYALDVSGSARTENDLYVNMKLGVGTTSPTEKLTVAGKALAEEVIVKPQSEWADYVFEEGYDLRSLKEVARFIEEKGHLPEVPTAESVEKTGLRLGEMDATLLQKIEELTLYAIEQKKRADSLSGQLSRQRRQMQDLRRRLTRRQEQAGRRRARVESREKRIRRLERQVELLRSALKQSGLKVDEAPASPPSPENED
jgi:hypothetical protein